MIYIIEDDELMAECIARACKKETKIFSNVSLIGAESTDTPRNIESR